MSFRIDQLAVLNLVTVGNSVTAGSFVRSGGTAAQFLMADGSVSTNPGWLTSITSNQVTTALGYTPYNATNPNGYTSNTGTVTSVSGTGTVSGLTLSGTVTSSGSLTLGGTLTLTSGQVTGALGYTPYNSSNPSGYITSSATISGASARLSSRDNRTISPSEDNAAELRFGFTSWANNDSAPYADYLHLRSYSDSSGGSDNLVMFLKSGIGMRIWQQSFGSGTAYSSYADVWHSGNLTNLNQLTNGPGYITSYTETDTLATVTARGATTSTALTLSGNVAIGGLQTRSNINFENQNGFHRIALWDLRFWDWDIGADIFSIGQGDGNVRVTNSLLIAGNTAWHAGNFNPGSYLPLSGGTMSGQLNAVSTAGGDHGLRVGAVRGSAVGSQSGDYIMLYERVHIGYPSGWGASLASAPTYGLGVWGNIHVSQSNATGGGIILADDGDIVDLNDSWCSMRFTSGVRIYSANRGGSAVISLGSNGVISAGNITTGVNASHIVQRDANGYIYANHINFNTSESENPAISSFITSNGDGWSRKSSLQHVKNSIRGVADGTWGINITGNAATLGGNGPGYYYPTDTPNGYASGDINGNGTHQRLWGTDSVQNLLAFRPPSSIEYSTNGSTWISVSATADLWDNKIFGKWGGFNMNVGNNTGAWRFVRMTWVNFGYHFFSNFTLAHSTNGHSFNFVFYKSDLNGNFGGEAFRMNGISSWPGYTFVRHSNVSGWWDTRDIRIVFELNHNNDFPNNSISIGHIGLMGGYSGFTRLYDWDASRNMSFANAVTAQGVIRSESNVRAPIYFDTDNTTYFLNLAGDGTQSAFLNGNVRINPKPEGWSEGLAFVMPSTSTWGGLRWQRQRGGNDGNWYIGYTALDATDDLVFGANNGGGQVDNIIRLQKDGTVRFRNRTYVHTYGAGGGENLFTGLDAPSSANGRAQFVLSSAYSDLVIASSQANGSHGSTLSFTTYNPGNAGDYRKFVINQGNWGARAGFLDFGFADTARTNPHGYINSTDDVMSLDGYNKRVGIGVMNPGYALDVAGTIYASGDVIAFSDARVKTNIRPIENPVERLLKSRGVLYDRIDTEDKNNIGFIAQELEQEFPELVTTGSDGKKAVKYQNMVAVLTEAIKEQQQQIEELKAKLDALT